MSELWTGCLLSDVGLPVTGRAVSERGLAWMEGHSSVAPLPAPHRATPKPEKHACSNLSHDDALPRTAASAKAGHSRVYKSC